MRVLDFFFYFSLFIPSYWSHSFILFFHEIKFLIWYSVIYLMSHLYIFILSFSVQNSLFSAWVKVGNSSSFLVYQSSTSKCDNCEDLNISISQMNNQKHFLPSNNEKKRDNISISIANVGALQWAIKIQKCVNIKYLLLVCF